MGTISAFAYRQRETKKNLCRDDDDDDNNNNNNNNNDVVFVVVKFFTAQLWLGNIHLSWDVVTNRVRLGGLICSLKSFLQLNMCQELQIFAVVICIGVQVKSC